MPIFNIKSAKWADKDKTVLHLIADTHFCEDTVITMSYGPESEWWDDVKNYDQALIGFYEDSFYSAQE